MKIKMCLCCGERYIGEEAYCSERCREENERIKKIAQKIKARGPQRPRIVSDLARVNEEARNAGMNYGEYEAMRNDAAHKEEWEKHKEELRKKLKKRGTRNGKAR